MTENEAQSLPRAAKSDFRLGPWLVQPTRNLISGAGKETRVEPMIMYVLVCLAESPGKTISRHTLNQRVWDGRIVGEKALTRAISNLRKAFDDNPRQPQYIETVSKIGYRLLVPAVFIESNHGPLLGNTIEKVPDIAMSENPMTSKSDSPSRYRLLWLPALFIIIGALLGWFLYNLRPGKPERHALPPAPSRPITTYPGHEPRPRLSPAGERVVFAWRGHNADNWDIYLQHVANGEPYQVTQHPDDDLSPAWSPDGSRIAFFRLGTESCGIYMQAIPGGEAQKVRDCFRIPAQNIAQVTPKLSWSPDGGALAFSVGSSEPKTPIRAALFSLRDGETTPLTNPPEGFIGDLDPTFSPDGRFLAVCRLQNWADRDLVVIDKQSGEERQVTFDGRVVLGHDWTRDGKHILFSSNKGGTYGLWMVARSGGSARWVPANGGYLKYPSLAVSHGSLVYEDWQYDTNIWKYSTSANDEPVSRVASTRWDFQPDYDEVHQRIAFVSNRSGQFEVWSCDPEGRQPRQLTYLGTGGVGSPRWSPDGQSIVFHVWRQGTADLFLWQRGQGLAKRFRESKAHELFADWSPDGRWLYFTSNKEDHWQIWRVLIQGGEPERITRDGGYSSHLSTDGNYLIFTREKESGVWRIPVTGGEPERLFDLDAPGDWGNLAVVDTGVFFIRRGTEFTAQLGFYHFQSGSIETRRSLNQNLNVHQPGMTAPRDGAWILLVQTDRTQSDIQFIESFDAINPFYREP